MRTKIRVLANIFVEDRLDESLFQFNRAIPVYRYHAIRAFVKNCPFIKNATEEDFQTVKLITILCSNDDNAMTILHGLEACAKNSFFNELIRKKANAVDTEPIKIALNSVYGKDAFNRDTDSVSEELRDIIRDAKEMSRFLKEKRDEFNDLSEYWRFNEEIARRYEEFAGIADYLNRSIDKFEDLVEKICKKENNNGKLD